MWRREAGTRPLESARHHQPEPARYSLRERQPTSSRHLLRSPATLPSARQGAVPGSGWKPIGAEPVRAARLSMEAHDTESERHQRECGNQPDDDHLSARGSIETEQAKHERGQEQWDRSDEQEHRFGLSTARRSGCAPPIGARPIASSAPIGLCSDRLPRIGAGPTRIGRCHSDRAAGSEATAAQAGR